MKTLKNGVREFKPATFYCKHSKNSTDLITKVHTNNVVGFKNALKTLIKQRKNKENKIVIFVLHMGKIKMPYGTGSVIFKNAIY